MLNLKKPLEFQWDRGNIDKNSKHNVTNEECEETFLDQRRVIFEDKKHSSEDESRYILLGQTNHGRLLYTAFVVRDIKIRVVSSRDINKKEVYLYEKTIK